MAASAVGAEFAIMNIVGTMAVTTTAFDGPDFIQRHAVTVVTANVDVGTVKGEVGLQIMIEGP